MNWSTCRHRLLGVHGHPTPICTGTHAAASRDRARGANRRGHGDQSDFDTNIDVVTRNRNPESMRTDEEGGGISLGEDQSREVNLIFNCRNAAKLAESATPFPPDSTRDGPIPFNHCFRASDLVCLRSSFFDNVRKFLL